MTDFVETAAYYSLSPIALIIGCGDMGMASARTLGQRHSLLVVDINGRRLADCVAVLGQEGYTVSGHQCDITNPEHLGRLAEVLAAGPGVRLLAHIAAVGNAPGGWRQIMNVDLVGAHLIARAVGPYMVRGGVAIFISSMGSYLCPRDSRLEALLDQALNSDFLDTLAQLLGHEPDFLEAYCIAKHGVNRLAEKLAIDWGSREVRSLSLSPGLINSTMGRTSGAKLPILDASREEKLGTRSEKAHREVPLRRQGTLLEISSVVAFLASDAASFINGVDIPVDGGARALWHSRGVTER